MQIECALCDCVLCVLFIEVRDLHMYVRPSIEQSRHTTPSSVATEATSCFRPGRTVSGRTNNFYTYIVFSISFPIKVMMDVHIVRPPAIGKLIECNWTKTNYICSSVHPSEMKSRWAGTFSKKTAKISPISKAFFRSFFFGMAGKITYCKTNIVFNSGFLIQQGPSQITLML